MVKQAVKRRISLVLIFSLLLSTLILPVIAFGAASVEFKDVADSYAQQEIQALTEAGIISGYGDNSFQPRKAITRAELAKIIVLSLGLKENPDKASSFQDVDSKSWYRGYVGALVESGITTGTSATTFSPENKVTREELVVFYIRALGLEETAKKLEADAKLTDLNEVSDWAKAYVSLAFKVGFVNGIEVNGALKFNPKDNAERQALVRLAYEFKINSAKYVEKAKEISGESKGGSSTPPGSDPGANAGGGSGTVQQPSSGSNASNNGSASFTIDTVEAIDNQTVEVTFTTSIERSDNVGPITINGGLTVLNEQPKYGTKTIVVTTGAQTVGQTYGVTYNGVDIGKTFVGKATTLTELDASAYTGSYRIAQAGTIGPASGSSTINGNLYIESSDVILQNVTINGDLVLGEQIGEGDVTLNNVTVNGQTFVNGGGSNSIHLQNTVLVSIIVDKRSGEVRVVAEGTTSVQQVTVQSSATLEESNASGNGFRNLSIPSNIQANSHVTLRGTFETADVIATNIAVSVPSGFINALNVRAEAANTSIHLGNATIGSLVLNAIAAITGNGVVQSAHVNVSGTTFERLPNETVLGNGAEAPAQSANSSTNSLQTIAVSNGKIKLFFNRPVTDAVYDDFNVTATLNGQAYQLQDLLYHSAEQGFTFSSLPADQYHLQDLSISVSPAPASTKFIRTASGSVKITGFEGTIYDVSNLPVSGLTIKFRAGIGSTVGPVVATVVTDNNGHYKVTLPAGTYTGELSKETFITTYVVGVAATNAYNTTENATAIRIAAADETRIVLVWGENPRDLDSHLVGPQPDAVSQFHTWYGGRIYAVNSVVYDDLDHDDVTSYGPETTTIRQNVYGTYRFYVHHYSGINTLRTSGAVVKVYGGNSADPVRTYSVPTGTGSERYWVVFEMTLTPSGVSFTEINQLVNTATQAQGSVINVATVTSSVYSVNQTTGTITYAPPAPSVTDFKSGLTPDAGVTFEVYESNGTTVKTGTIASGDKVIVTAANGITQKSYTIVEGTVVSDTTAPTTVTGITYTATYNSIQLSWQPSTDNSSTVTYAVYNGTTLVGTTTGTTYNVTGLQPATSYTFDIRAFDPFGNYSGHSYQPAKTTVILSVYNVYTASNNTVTSGVYGPLTTSGAGYVIPNTVGANDYFVVQFSDTLASDNLTGVLANNSIISLDGLTGTVEASVYEDVYLVFRTTDAIPTGQFNFTIRGLKNTVSSVVYDVEPITLNFDRQP